MAEGTLPHFQGKSTPQVIEIYKNASNASNIIIFMYLNYWTTCTYCQWKKLLRIKECIMKLIFSFSFLWTDFSDKNSWQLCIEQKPNYHKRIWHVKSSDGYTVILLKVDLKDAYTTKNDIIENYEYRYLKTCNVCKRTVLLIEISTK